MNRILLALCIVFAGIVGAHAQIGPDGEPLVLPEGTPPAGPLPCGGKPDKPEPCGDFRPPERTPQIPVSARTAQQHKKPEAVRASQATKGFVQAAVVRNEMTRLRAVLVYSRNGCETCKEMMLKVQELSASRSIAGVDFQTLEYDEKNRDAFIVQAYLLGFGEQVEKNDKQKIEPGSLLLIDTQRRKLVSEIKADVPTKEIAQELLALSQQSLSKG